MKKLLLAFLFFSVLSSSIALQIDLLDTAATIRGNTIELVFKASGGVSPYTFTFFGTPFEWKTNSNRLIVTGLAPTTNRAWTFDIFVVDGRKQSLLLTVKLSINGYQIEL